MQSAAKVGLLVVVFAALVLGGYAVLGQSLWQPAKTRYFAEFQDAGGIQRGAQILIAGVPVGSVSAVSLVSPRMARVTLMVDAGVELPNGTKAVIADSLIGLGETPLSLVAPAGALGKLAPDSVLQGSKPGPLEKVLPEGEQLVVEMSKTLTALRALLENRELQDNVTKLVKSTDRTMVAFGDLAQRFDGVAAQNQDAIRRSLNQAADAAADVRRLTDRLATLAEDPRFEREAKGILANVRSTTVKIDGLVADLRAAVNDPQLREPLAKAATNAAEITESGKRMALKGEEIAANGATVSAKAIDLTDRANELMAKANAIADDVKKLIEQVSGVVGGARSGPSLNDVKGEMNLTREDKPGRWRTDVVAEIPVGNRALALGVYDAFESNSLIAQVVNDPDKALRYRYGMYGGKAGIGVDYSVAPRLSLIGDLWDLNDPRFDLRASYEFGDGLLGWVGLERAFRDNAYSFGIGFRR
jgi:phospholipid/cholesterol/gamma-HCH transport system substrate-binding protein